MSLIAVSVEASGAARMFFDLRTTRPTQEDQRRIAAAIAQAQNILEQQLPRAA